MRIDPDYPAVRMAQDLGISRERVRQLLIKLRLPTRVPRKVPMICVECSKLLELSEERSRKGKYRKCNSCTLERRKGVRVEVTCAYCSKKLIRKRSHIERNKHFHACDKICWAKFRKSKTFRGGIMRATT